MRKRLKESFLANEEAALAAMARRWASTKHVQDMWELLARLEGELSKDAAAGARGISVIFVNNTGRRELGPGDVPGGRAAEGPRAAWWSSGRGQLIAALNGNSCGDPGGRLARSDSVDRWFTATDARDSCSTLGASRSSFRGPHARPLL
jgi:hypothetical protein